MAMGGGGDEPLPLHVTYVPPTFRSLNSGSQSSYAKRSTNGQNLCSRCLVFRSSCEYLSSMMCYGERD
jgi:hypothetical protein